MSSTAESVVSVVVPARNEEVTLPLVLRDIEATRPRLAGRRLEVIVVDDHSTDATAEVARRCGAAVVANPGRNGKGSALRVGFAAAAGEVLVMMDADYSHRPEDLPLLLGAMTGGVGLVIGSRIIGGSEEYTPVRALGNIFLSTAMGLATGRYLSDALNGYKALRRDVFTDFAYTSRAFEIEIEIIANALRKGYRIVEVPSHERSRAGGAVKSRVVRHGSRFLLRIVREWLRGVRPQEAA